MLMNLKFIFSVQTLFSKCRLIYPRIYLTLPGCQSCLKHKISKLILLTKPVPSTASSISIYCNFIIPVAQGENLGVILNGSLFLMPHIQAIKKFFGYISKIYTESNSFDHPHGHISVRTPILSQLDICHDLWQ